MSKDRNTSLDIVSNLDEEIIARTSERRYKLLSRPHRRPIARYAVIAAAAVLLLALVGGVVIASFGDGLFGNGESYLTSDGRMVPIYQGMTISQNAPTVSAAIATHGVQTLDLGDTPAVDAEDVKQSEEATEVDQEDPFDKAEGEDTIEDAIGAIVDVVGPAEKIYYTKRNEDFYVTIHINNPDSVEILSFTLNGVKYSSYMFEQGSDMENLVLKCNAGDTSGVIEYTIDAIKYIDGTDIKDVRMEGDRTVTVGVYTENQPFAQIGNEIVGHSHVSFEVSVSDPYPLITSEEDSVFAVVYDGEQIVAQSAVTIGEQMRVTFEDLEPDKIYQYAVVAVYDALDGQGRALYVLGEKAFVTDRVLTMTDFSVTSTEFSFDLQWSEFFADKALKSVSLWKDGGKVRDLDVTETVIGDLLSDSEYTVIIEYDYNGGTERIETTFVTEANEKPSVSIKLSAVDKHSIAFLIEETDNSNVGELQKVEIFDAKGELVATVSGSERIFEGLLADNEYKVVMTYVYDLNDGSEPVTVEQEIKTSTAKHFKPYASLRTTKKDYTWMLCSIMLVDSDGLLHTVKVERWDGDAWTDIGAEESYMFEDLLPGTAYNFRVTWKYDMKDGKGIVEESKIYELSTKAYKTPTVEISSFDFDPFSVDFELDITDVDEVGYLTKVELVRADGSVIKADSLEQRSFEELEPLQSYILRIIYEYDLLDDLGTRTLEVTRLFVPRSVGLNITNNVVTGIGSCTDSVLYINDSIAAGAFAGNKNITAVHIGSGAESIGSGAFEDAAKLTTVVIHNGLKNIQDSVFRNCGRLSSVTLPDSLRTLGSDAFSHASRLESIHLPSNLKMIPTNAFYECAMLESITGGENVKVIGDFAFSYCKKLKSFESLDKLTHIGDNAFSWCSLERIEFPDTLEKIGNYAFDGNYNVRYIVIPKTVTNIGEKIFLNCQDIAFLCEGDSEADLWDYDWCYVFDNYAASVYYGIDRIEQNGGLTYGVTKSGEKIIVAYDGSVADVVLPAGTVAICRGAFRENKTVESIVIPEGITEICTEAFSNCEKLKSVKLPSSLKVIGDRAFGWCHALEDIKLPDGLESIGVEAFVNDHALQGYFIIPSSVTTIGEKAFEYMSDNLTLCVSSATKPSGWNVSWNGYDNPTKVIWNFDSIYELDGVAYIELNDGSAIAVSCSKEVTEVVIPEGVTEIGAEAFSNCEKLKSVELPSSLKVIGDRAFGWCYALEDIELPDGLESIGVEAFVNDHSLQGYFIIPTSVTTIGERAFEYMSSNLTLCVSSATKPSGWNVSWNGYDNPTKVLWNFDSIYELDGVTYIELNDGTATAIKSAVDVTAVVIPEGVTEIADNCFSGCTALVSVELPSTLKRIGANAFYKCGIESIVIPDGVTEMAEGAFSSCRSLVTVKIPAGITALSSSVFSSCRSLESIIIPEGVTEIGAEAFRNCEKLKSVKLPSSLKVIGDRAFGWCHALEDIELPDGLEKIGKEAFFNANSIKGYFVIPSSVIEIGEKAFEYMSDNLTLCVSSATKPSGWNVSWNGYDNPTKVLWNFDSIYELDGVAYIELNDGSVIAVGCSNEVTEVVIPEGVTEIADNCFSGCTALVSVELPSTLKRIGNNAFYNSGISSIEIPDSVTEIGEVAFRNCSSLVSAKLPATIKVIPDELFYDCVELLSIVIPEGVTEIGDYAFGSCEKLASVVLPKSLKIIGDGAFWHSYKLEFPELPEGLESIGAEAFWNTGNDLGRHQNIIIPLSVTKIGKAAFWYSYNITIYARAASMPSGWSKDMLGDTGTAVIWNFDRFMTDAQGVNYAIYADGDMVVMSYSGSAKNIVLPSGVVYIERNAFENNDIIESIIIPEGVTEIGDYAFANCIYLESVSLPSTLKRIGSYAFGNCRILSSVELPEGLEELGNCAFENCKLLNTIELPTGITYVSNGLFAGSGLVSIVIPEGVTEIGDNAFSHCYSLVSIKLPSTLKKIESYAFCDCDAIKELELPDGLEYIGEWAFSNCDGLIVAVIPDSVTNIRAYAFEHDYNLIAILASYDSRPSGWDVMWNGFDRVSDVYWGFEGFQTIDGVRYALFADGSKIAI